MSEKEITNIRIRWGKHPDRNLPPKDIYQLFDYIDSLKAQLSTALSEKSAYREALREIKDYFRYSEGTSRQADQIFLFNRIKAALDLEGGVNCKQCGNNYDLNKSSALNWEEFCSSQCEVDFEEENG